MSDAYFLKLHLEKTIKMNLFTINHLINKMSQIQSMKFLKLRTSNHPSKSFQN